MTDRPLPPDYKRAALMAAEVLESQARKAEETAKKIRKMLGEYGRQNQW